MYIPRHFKLPEFNFHGDTWNGVTYAPIEAKGLLNETFLEQIDNAREIATQFYQKQTANPGAIQPFVVSYNGGIRPEALDRLKHGIPFSDHSQLVGSDIKFYKSSQTWAWINALKEKYIYAQPMFNGIFKLVQSDFYIDEDMYRILYGGVKAGLNRIGVSPNGHIHFGGENPYKAPLVFWIE